MFSISASMERCARQDPDHETEHWLQRIAVHTYSTYGRGTGQVGGTHYYLEMTALGRQEDWEEPKGRAELLGPRADQRGAGGAADRL